MLSQGITPELYYNLYLMNKNNEKNHRDKHWRAYWLKCFYKSLCEVKEMELNESSRYKDFRVIYFESIKDGNIKEGDTTISVKKGNSYHIVEHLETKDIVFVDEKNKKLINGVKRDELFKYFNEKAYIMSLLTEKKNVDTNEK